MSARVADEVRTVFDIQYVLAKYRDERDRSRAWSILVKWQDQSWQFADWVSLTGCNPKAQLSIERRWDDLPDLTGNTVEEDRVFLRTVASTLAQKNRCRIVLRSLRSVFAQLVSTKDLAERTKLCSAALHCAEADCTRLEPNVCSQEALASLVLLAASHSSELCFDWCWKKLNAHNDVHFAEAVVEDVIGTLAKKDSTRLGSLVSSSDNAGLRDFVTHLLRCAVHKAQDTTLMQQELLVTLTESVIAQGASAVAEDRGVVANASVAEGAAVEAVGAQSGVANGLAPSGVAEGSLVEGHVGGLIESVLAEGVVASGRFAEGLAPSALVETGLAESAHVEGGLVEGLVVGGAAPSGGAQRVVAKGSCAEGRVIEGLAPSGVVETGLVETALLEGSLVEGGLAERVASSGVAEGVAQSARAEGVASSGLAEGVAHNALVEGDLVEAGLVEGGVVGGVAPSVVAGGGLAEVLVVGGVAQSALAEGGLVEGGFAKGSCAEVRVTEGLAPSGVVETGLVETGLVETALLEGSLVEDGLAERVASSRVAEGVAQGAREGGLVEGGFAKGSVAEGRVAEDLAQSGVAEGGLVEGFVDGGIASSGVVEGGLVQTGLAEGVVGGVVVQPQRAVEAGLVEAVAVGDPESVVTVPGVPASVRQKPPRKRPAIEPRSPRAARSAKVAAVTLYAYSQQTPQESHDEVEVCVAVNCCLAHYSAASPLCHPFKFGQVSQLNERPQVRNRQV
eukprot:TRINITY_DN469_c0_g1_i10.p1 TRINITY_DN469_c0_g1~~TRINITY_DN469_c0_g1_i10.p1  ORF type:complete len:735 (+),score=78.95 TRINITY_DN469_c0_g1_i10:192-2396(+)